MGKPRRKGMKKGYLKRFSAQLINGGAYSPKTLSKAEEARPKKSAGFGVLGRPGESYILPKPPPALPPTKGSTIQTKERTEKWHAQVKKDKVLYGAIEHFKIFDGKSMLHVKQAGVKFAPNLSCGEPLPLGPYNLCFEGNSWYWLYVKNGQIEKKSIIYSSAKTAERRLYSGQITWL